MTEQEALYKMIAPGTQRPSKYRGGVIQILVTSSCDKTCFGCTQASNLSRKPWFMSPAHFEQALQSLEGWWGVVGVFGGNPAVHPQFETLCDLLCKYFPREQRGLWCNHPLGKGAAMRRTFDPRVSNLNVHLDPDAYNEFKQTWPESLPFGLTQDSRHSPPWVAMRDVLWKECQACEGTGEGERVRLAPTNMVTTRPCKTCDGTGEVYDEARAWELISNCDINQHWSAGIGVFRGQLRAWFCEVAMAQSILHQDEPGYPDTGIPLPGEPATEWVTPCPWWELPMSAFKEQVRKHCHECGVPLRGHGELAQAADDAGKEQVSATHRGVYKPKHRGRAVELVITTEQLGRPLGNVTKYVQNARE